MNRVGPSPVLIVSLAVILGFVLFVILRGRR
jgi:hypothetical protein